MKNNSIKPRLLLTDSDPVLLQICRTYFPNFGFDVETASNGVECLEQLRSFSPDVLVLSHDLNWGGADGVLSVIREGSEFRPIPVVITGGEIRRGQVRQLLIPPVVKLLDKPFRLRDLRTILITSIHGPMECHAAQFAFSE